MFFRFILIAILPFSFSARAQGKDNENNKIYTIEEINADLLKRKKEIEGFSQDEVKVDLESLGLDDVEEKKLDKTAENEQKEPEKQSELPPINIAPEKSEKEPETLPQLPSVEPEKPTENKNLKELPLINPNSLQEDKKSEKPAKKEEIIKQTNQTADEKDSGINNSTSTSSILSRIQSILKSREGKPSQAQENQPKDSKQYINKEKKKNIAKINRKKARQKALELKREKARKAHEAYEKKRIAKLKLLRKKYLQNVETDIENTDDYLNSSRKIMPKRKELSNFLLEEAPPKPLINDYRTRDNLHIPLLLKPRQRIEILFNSISIGSVSLFNDAYNYIGNPNIRNSHGDTLLTYAIITRKYPIIAAVISKGADLNLPNALNYTPMHIAIILKDFKTIEMLANNNADLNYVDIVGQNYLMYAVRYGNLSAAELFVRKGIDINGVDRNGITAITMAHNSKQDIMAQFLLKNGSKTWQEKVFRFPENSLIEELENRWK